MFTAFVTCFILKILVSAFDIFYNFLFKKR